MFLYFCMDQRFYYLVNFWHVSSDKTFDDRKKIAEGKFPAPHKLVPGGRAAGWFESTIDAWLKSVASQNEDVE